MSYIRQILLEETKISVVSAIGVSSTSWEDAARNALVNIVQSQGENLPQSGTFVIDVKRFTAEGTYGLVYEATIQHYKVQVVITFQEGV
ncbi:MAG: hypothetical protein ACFFB3_10950 [Candidatus Hodarchaeota archaeon]